MFLRTLFYEFLIIYLVAALSQWENFEKLGAKYFCIFTILFLNKLDYHGARVIHLDIFIIEETSTNHAVWTIF